MRRISQWVVRGAHRRICNVQVQHTHTQIGSFPHAAVLGTGSHLFITYTYTIRSFSVFLAQTNPVTFFLLYMYIICTTYLGIKRIHVFCTYMVFNFFFFNTHQNGRASYQCACVCVFLVLNIIYDSENDDDNE